MTAMGEKCKNKRCRVLTALLKVVPQQQKREQPRHNFEEVKATKIDITRTNFR
jgi:hypothetical protein